MLAASTRWFAFRGWSAVPFEIQDEVLLLWALKDFVAGSWKDIPYPVTRFVASYSLVPVLGMYFAYNIVTGVIGGLGDVIHSFLLHTSHGYDEASVWVWAPRLVSWLSLVASVPLQYVLVSRATGSRTLALLASVLLNFSFLHLYSSMFGLPDGLGFLVFQMSLLGLISYVRKKNVRTTLSFSVLIACMFLIRLQNAVALLFAGVFYLVLMRGENGFRNWKSIGRELFVLATGALVGIVIINPLIYLNPSIILKEILYGIGEWAPRTEWNMAAHLAYLSRVVFHEVLGIGLTLLTGLAIIVLTIRRFVDDRHYRFLFVPLFFFIASMAYLSEMSYETAMLIILVPATTLAAWSITQLSRWIGRALGASSISLQTGVPIFLLFIVLANPLIDWFALYALATREGTRASARHWIHENVPEGSSVIVAPYTYTVPLVQSIDQLRRSAPTSELTHWREANKVIRELTPTYRLFTDWQVAVDQDLAPKYYVRTSFAHLPGKCSWEGVWAHLLCPYDPLRGSFPHFSQVNQMPENPPGAEIMLLKEFNPICPESLDQTIYINYRTNVLRNNVRYLCLLGPIIEVYRLNGIVGTG